MAEFPTNGNSATVLPRAERRREEKASKEKIRLINKYFNAFVRDGLRRAYHGQKRKRRLAPLCC